MGWEREGYGKKRSVVRVSGLGEGRRAKEREREVAGIRNNMKMNEWGSRTL